MDVPCIYSNGKEVCTLSMDSMPALDMVFENGGQFYKVKKVDVEGEGAQAKYTLTVAKIAREKI